MGKDKEESLAASACSKHLAIPFFQSVKVFMDSTSRRMVRLPSTVSGPTNTTPLLPISPVWDQE